MFKQNPDKISYPEIEKQISEFWKKNQIFEKSISERSEKKSYTFYEGPPTANGKPGIHHVMARSLKDIICRYKTLRGYQVHRKAGWDTHGLPVEIEVEKALGIKSKDQIPVFGVDKYNAACRESVFTYKDLWEKMTERMGYWIDLDDAYITCTNEYIESVWWSLKTLFDKGLIYKDYKIVPQCPRSETVLSSHELALGYKMTKDPSVYALFKMKESDEYILVWTTTPWTLISNVALAFGSDVDYVKVLHKEKKIILAKARLAVLDGEYEILEEFKGASMEHKEYEQLLPYITPQKKAFYIVLGDFVSTEDGTGIVHIAPAFGADDYEISKKYGLPMMQPVRPNGTFTSEVPDFENVFFKDADNGILKKMKAEGKLYKKETIEHSYPFSWRFDDVPVLYYARESWFIRTTSVAERMVELNATINWYPPETGSGRFGNWLAENKDWALSRDRFWATPLPIWLSEDGDMIAIGSIEELKQGFLYEGDKKITVSEVKEIDLHKPFIDKVFFEKNGKIYKRTPELIDVWYDSGAMPFAQYHYPFENKEWFESNFPADYISEGIDQTRGWFYTLHAISTMLFDKVAYRNVLVNDLILDKEGRKMSKSKGNTVDPFMLFDKYGADATRWYLIINSPPWKPTLFNEDDLAENQRKFFGTLMNTYSFFVMYANIDKFTFAEDLIPYDQRPETDRWIISKLNSVTAEYLRLMDEYDITKAARLISNFTIDQVSNWYVRRSRRRFWKSEMNQNKLSAYQTLYEVLERITKLMAPITPFIAEDIYQSLNRVTGHEKFESVHLALFEQPEYFDQALEDKMETAQQVVSMTRGMRAKLNLKIRQPLSKLMVAVDPSKADALRTMEEVVLEELNIKELQILSDDSGIVSKSAKPNFKAIGPRFGKQVNQVAGMIKELPADQVAKLDKGESVELSLNGAAVTITPADVEIISSDIKGWSVESDNGITVALDTELTEVLIAEGLSREFVNRVQNMRKDAGFEVTDRIRIVYTADDQLTKAVEQFKGSIASETLASEVLNSSAAGGGYRQSWVIDKFNAEIEIQKV